MLEDVEEYKKIDKTIKTTDRILEKLASISNLTYYVGNTRNVKWRRQAIVKNVIDILFIHNRNLKKIYDERKNKIEELYGIPKQFTNLFYFDVNNSIFTTSSAQTDFYKLIKANNVVAYTIISMILNINENQLLTFVVDKNGKSDKICNIHTYLKSGIKMFENVKIIINKNGETNNIIKYNVLSFLVYYLSCLIAKHKIWYVQNATPSGETNENTQTIIKIISHTIVDALNSLLEISMVTTDIVYDIMTNNYFLKLSNLYKSDTIIDIIKTKTNIGTTKKIDARIPTKKPDVATISLPGAYAGAKYAKSPLNVNIIPFIHYNKSKHRDKTRKILPYNSVTHCVIEPSVGNYHYWVVDNTKLKCKLCGVYGDQILLANNKNVHDKNIYEKLTNISKYKSLRKISKNKCVRGATHEYINGVCAKCNKKEDDDYDNHQLDKLAKVIDVDRNEKIKKSMSMTNIIESQFDTMRKIQKDNLTRLQKLYESNTGSSLDITVIIKKFMSTIKKLFDSAKNDLHDNYYVIDHDHYGNSLKKNIIVSETENKILLKQNHSFFKTDVLYYTNKQLNVDLFYDAVRLVYLGYKEHNKEFVFSELMQNVNSSIMGSADSVKNKETKSNPEYNNHKGNYLIINYSISHKLLYLGFNGMFTEIPENINSENKTTSINNIVDNLLIERLNKLKKCLIYIQRLLYSVKNKQVEKNVEETKFADMFKDDMDDPIKQLAEKYASKLKNMNVENVFVEWKQCYESIFQQHKYTETETNPRNYINSKDLSAKDISGNYILCYIILELQKLILSNEDAKIIMGEFIHDIITTLYDWFNEERFLSNYDVKRFAHIIGSKYYIFDTERKGLGIAPAIETEFTDDEEPKSKDEDFDALDVELSNTGEDEEMIRDFSNASER